MGNKIIKIIDIKNLLFGNIDAMRVILCAFVECINMVTSEVVKSRVNVPPFQASIKDGYAVRFIDNAGKRNVISVSNAGDKNVNIWLYNSMFYLNYFLVADFCIFWHLYTNKYWG